MAESIKILGINPGSTSTKIAYYQDLKCVSGMTVQHSPEELSNYNDIIKQYPLRMKTVLDYIFQQDIQISNLDAVVGRGGLLKPLKGGTYLINRCMLEDLKNQKFGEHASNLGALLAHELANMSNKPSYVVNPVVVDEMWPLAGYSGLKCIKRKSAFHALNQKAMAIKAAESLCKSYNDVNLVVAHMGGGVSVAAHLRGNVIDVNNALEEGAFTPERSGSLPALQLVELCFSGNLTKEEVKKLLVGNGGLVSYLGTSNCMEIEKMIAARDYEARNVIDAMAYQIAKEIGAQSTALSGWVDGIVLTGGLAYSRIITESIKGRVQFIAPVIIFPGEDEMLAMAEGVHRVLTGVESSLNYTYE